MRSELPGLQDAQRFTTDIIEKYDVAIVGSGAGGAVIAKELAEKGAKVVILEEGGHHREHRDSAYDAIRRLYRDEGLTTTLGSPIIPVPMGRAFGGTTVINSGTCFRVPQNVFERWHTERHLDQLGAEEFDRAYARVEKEINVEEADFKVMSRPNSQMHELLLKQGFHGAPLRRNIRGCEGCGMCCYGCSSGAKQSMDVSYLPKALEAGAIAYTHARVYRILTDKKGAASGVLADAVDRTGKRTGYRIRIKADRVIVSAGTFFTPRLLKSSGVARGNKHLGRHLTLHPATKLFAEFDEVINGWDGTPQAYSYDGMHDQGIMFEGIFTPPDLAGMTTTFVGQKLIDFMKRYSHMTSFGFMISDESEGRISWLPFFGTAFFYSLTQGDIERIRKAVAFLGRVFLKGGAKRVYPLIRNRQFNTLEDVDEFEKAPLRAGDIDLMAFHPLGTCRMSSAAHDGVCDQNHEVWGTPRLYVCDGSAIPTALGVNPQLTIMAFATRLAERLTSS